MPLVSSVSVAYELDNCANRSIACAPEIEILASYQDDVLPQIVEENSAGQQLPSQHGEPCASQDDMRQLQRGCDPTLIIDRRRRASV